MVSIKFPGDWEENEQDEQDEHEFSNTAYAFGAALAFIGFVVLSLGTLVALSWPLSWLWNIAMSPFFDFRSITWYEFAAGWTVGIVGVWMVKKIFRG